jgi:glycosyltransferase involved in cell wall biosynthesis
MRINNKNCFYLPNAADFEHFHSAVQVKQRPKEIESLSRPIIGFIGAIFDWIDIDLICKLAKLHPNYSILLVGPVNYGLKKLRKHSNIVMVGAKQYKILPQYLSCMDVCLLPFKINKLTMASNPIKLYEYLAAGKPVVSTALPEVCGNASDIVYIGENNEDFIKKVEEAVSENKKPENEDAILKRINFAKNNSWEKRIETFEKLIEVTHVADKINGSQCACCKEV